MVKRSLLILTLLCAIGKLQANEKQFSFDALHDSIELNIYSAPATSLKYAKLLLAKGFKDDNNTEIGKGLAGLSRSYFFLKDFENAQIEAIKLIRHAKSTKDTELLIRALLLRYDIEMILTDVDQSHALLLRSLELADSIESDLYRETVMSKLAGFYELSGDTEKAIEMRLKTLGILESRPADSTFTEEMKLQTIVYGYAVLASSYVKLERLDSAEYFNEKSRILALESDSCKLIYYYNIKGEINLKQKQYDSAHSNFTKSLNYCPPDYSLFDLNMAFRFGRVAYGQNDFEKTIEILAEGLAEYEVSEAEETYMDEYYKLLADSYKAVGEYEKANFYFEKYIHTQRSLNDLKGDLSAKMKAEEVAVFQAEIDRHKKSQAQKERRTYFMILGGALIIIILLLILLRFYQVKRKNEKRFQNILETIERDEKIVENEAIQLVNQSELGISSEIVAQIIDGLNKLEDEKFFLKQDCSAYAVAKKLKTNTSYLSKVINHHYQKNFNTYINDLRIKYAIIRLKNEKNFRAYSIQAIAEEIGYKSADSFAKYFKLETGLNPSFYLKQLNNIPE